MAGRETNKPTRFERMYKIWDYLRNHTDRNHPTSIARMRNDKRGRAYIGDKQTVNRLIKDMAHIMNLKEDINQDVNTDDGDDAQGIEYKPESEWKLYFDDFKKFYGDEERYERDDIEEYSSYMDNVMHIKNLYYNRTFSEQEVDSIIEGILATRTLDSVAAQELIRKVEDNMTTEFYKRTPRHICKVQEPELADRELLKNNLSIIQKAIDDNVRISFRFNGYSYEKKLEPVREEKDELSPYYIVASGGRYYLLAAKEYPALQIYMSIWRIDLMTDIEIPQRKDRLHIKGIPRIPKKNVVNLPLKWSDDFQLKHLNMSFDKPVSVTLRIKSEKCTDNPKKRVRPGYTFLHDWFGDSFRYIRTEDTPPYDDIVRVECSPYGMAHWALQYSELVEVLEPESLRNDIKDKIRSLNSKYSV